MINSDNASATPMTDRLATIIEDRRRGYPGRSDDELYALAWHSLSPAQRAQVFDEESGAYRQRMAEDERIRAAAVRADGRERRNVNVDKHTEIANLVSAVSGLFEEPIAASDRAEILREEFADYAKRTGRDPLKDIADSRVASGNPRREMALNEPSLSKAGARQELALTVLAGKAAALRKVMPDLTEAQAFARVYSAPENAELAQIERSASRARFAEQAGAQLRESGDMRKRLLIATRDGAIDELWKRADELRRVDPGMSRDQAFAKVYRANPALAARERRAARDALYAV